MSLLRADPHGLVVRHQNTIHMIVRKYIGSGMFTREEFEDVVQAVNEALLGKLPRIQAQYNGSTLVRTYLSSIIRNICLKIRQKSMREPRTDRLDGSLAADSVNIQEKYVIEHDILMLRAILQQYDLQLPKLLLCLKLRFRIPLTRDDVVRYSPGCSEEEYSEIMGAFSGDYQTMTDKKIYAVVTPFMNRTEGRVVSHDAVRKWIHARLQEIVELLNGSPPTSSYDEESLKLLVEDYFFPFLLER
ncbi:MAG: sigma-70 family RNA polymerase sigma factor [Bacteroidota bacterium]